jgi:DNA repair protein RAD50
LAILNFISLRYTKALDNIKAIRKDRVSELKTEKERLEGLQREKTHADKLKTRISDMNASITAKEVNYEAKVAEYNELAISNKKFYELGSKFRDIYQKIETLEDKKERFKIEKAETEATLQYVDG